MRGCCSGGGPLRRFPALRFHGSTGGAGEISGLFSSHIRNPNTRRAYREAVRQFSAFCAQNGIVELAQVEPVHVAAFVEDQLRQCSKPTVKQRLAALRMLFDWLVVGQVLPANPAHAVRGPKHAQKKGKTLVLTVDEARALIDAIDTASLPGLRDRPLIGLMIYAFARVGAAVSMRVEDFYVQGRRGWVRLHEKGGKEHEMPTHHNLDHYLEEHIAIAGIAADRKGPLFRTARGRSGELTFGGCSRSALPAATSASAWETVGDSHHRHRSARHLDQVALPARGGDSAAR